MKNPVKILITFALETEFSPWRKLHGSERVQGIAEEIYVAKMTGVEIRLALTGAGPLNAQRVARVALDWRPDACLCAGLAGGLRNSQKLGEVFTAREIRDLQTGRTLVPDERLLACAAELGFAPCERLVSSAEMILSSEAKHRLSAMACAVDMESFAVLWEAEARRIPAIAIRAISDAAEESLPMDFSAMLDSEGKISNGKAARALASAPHKIPGVLRLALHSRRAASNLADALDHYIARLAASENLFVQPEALRA